MVAPRSRNAPARVMGALAVAVLLVSACYIVTSSRHSSAANPSELISASHAADLQAKAAATRSKQAQADRERGVTEALEKKTDQLRTQTEAAVAFAKAQTALLQKDKADALAAKERTAKLNAQVKVGRLDEAAALARSSMLQKVADKAQMQYAKLIQANHAVSAVVAKSKADTAEVNRNAHDAILHALAAAKQFAKINSELALQNKDGSALASSPKGVLSASEQIKHRQLHAGKHVKLADKAFVKRAADAAQRAKDLWRQLFHKPAPEIAPKKPASPSLAPSKGTASSKFGSADEKDDAEVAVATNPVWSSPAQNGARDVAQAALNALNLLGRGSTKTKQEEIVVLTPLQCHDVIVGSSTKQRKRVRITMDHLTCPTSVTKKNWITPKANYDDKFKISQSASGSSIVVDRLDKSQGWGMNLIIRCCEQRATPIPPQTAPSIAHVNPSKVTLPTVTPKVNVVKKVLPVVNGCVTIAVGSSTSDIKPADAAPKGFVCPKRVSKVNWATSDKYNDVFDVTQTSEMTIVNRIDKRVGWGMDLKFKCCIPPPAPKPSPQAAPKSPSKPPAEPSKSHATSQIGKKAEAMADAAKKAMAALLGHATVQSPAGKAPVPSSKLPPSSAPKSTVKSLGGNAHPSSGSGSPSSPSKSTASVDVDASNIDNFGLAGDLPAIRKEIRASLGDLSSDAVVKLSKKIEASLRDVQNADVKGISKNEVASALAKAQAAAKDAADSEDIANKARIAAAKSNAFLFDANKAKVAAVAKEQAASKAAAAATAAANSLKAKLAEATSASLLLGKKAQVAHAAYLEAKKVADLLKSKAAETAKASAASIAASKAAQLKAASAKESATLAAKALALSVKTLSEKQSKLKELNVVVDQARKARDVAAAAAAKALKEAEATKTLNSAKLAAAHKAAAAAEADLKAKIAAAAVASRSLRVAGASRLRKQKLAVAADAAFVAAKGKYKTLKEAAIKSSKAAAAAESESQKAAISAKSALKVYLARRQSDLTWPGKKPVIA